MTTKEITLSNGKPVPSERLTGLKPKKSVNELLKAQGIRGQERVDKVLLILLDASGSMHDPMENSTKIDVAWRILKDELMPNMANWTYGILKFQGWEEATWEVYPCQDTQALVVTSTPYASGSTPMRQALEKAWVWVKGHAKQARFILLSDGCPTDSSTEEILRLAQENKSIPIDTIGIGAGSIYGEYNKEFLTELSSITGGIFSEASSVKKLATTILELSPSQRPLLGTVKEE